MKLHNQFTSLLLPTVLHFLSFLHKIQSSKRIAKPKPARTKPKPAKNPVKFHQKVTQTSIKIYLITAAIQFENPNPVTNLKTNSGDVFS
jgi:hypothetical protein